MGTYPQPTSQFFDFINDGSLVYSAAWNMRGSPTIVSGANQLLFRDWDINSYFTVGYANGPASSSLAATVIVLFPEARDITHFHVNTQNAPTLAGYSLLRTSQNTTDGVDGTWTTQIDLSAYAALSTYANYTPTALALTAIKAVEIAIGTGGANVGLRALGLWGNYSSTTGLVFWDGTNNVAMPGDNFDFGDLAPSTTITREFRIKNTDSQTANTITIAASNSVNVGSIYSGLTFSTDGTNYASSIQVTSLTSGQLSSKLYVRRTVPAVVAQNTHGTTLIQAIPASWS